MTFKLREAMPMDALIMLVEDENGKRQVFVRAFSDTHYALIQCNETGPHAIRLEGEIAEKYDNALVHALKEFTEQLLEKPLPSNLLEVLQQGLKELQEEQGSAT